jgi:hypothetical protein
MRTVLTELNAMKRKRQFERYASTEDGRIAIDVAVPGAEDLYNDFESATPFPKNDLNDEFADYLIDSARKIGSIIYVST